MLSRIFSRKRSQREVVVPPVTSRETSMYKTLLQRFGDYLSGKTKQDFFCSDLPRGAEFDMVTWKKLVHGVFHEALRQGDFHLDAARLCYYPLWHPAWEYILNRPA